MFADGSKLFYSNKDCSVLFLKKNTQKTKNYIKLISGFKEKASVPAITKDEKLCNNSL